MFDVWFVPSENHHLKTGNCPTTSGNEELFDIEGITSYQEQKT